jgi:predicted acyl esterase
MNPGMVNPIDITPAPTSNLFARGHRIRPAHIVLPVIPA